MEETYITVKFNSYVKWYKSLRHPGLDYSTKTSNTLKGIGLPIHATARFKWKEVGEDRDDNGKFIKRGKYVILEHKDGFTSHNYHLDRDTYQNGYIEGNAGDIIGYSGDTGYVLPIFDGAHLHYELRRYGIPVDPLHYMRLGEEFKVRMMKEFLLRVENHGNIKYFKDNKLININRDNCWEVITQEAKGINQEDYNDLKDLVWQT